MTKIVMQSLVIDVRFALETVEIITLWKNAAPVRISENSQERVGTYSHLPLFESHLW